MKPTAVDLILNPWWFAAVVAGFAGAGYFRDGRVGAIEGAVVAVVLAHGALLEVLREERRRSASGLDSPE